MDGWVEKCNVYICSERYTHILSWKCYIYQMDRKPDAKHWLFSLTQSPPPPPPLRHHHHDDECAIMLDACHFSYAIAIFVIVHGGFLECWKQQQKKFKIRFVIESESFHISIYRLHADCTFNMYTCVQTLRVCLTTPIICLYRVYS